MRSLSCFQALIFRKYLIYQRKLLMKIKRMVASKSGSFHSLCRSDWGKPTPIMSFDGKHALSWCVAYQVAATAQRPARTCCEDASRPLRKISKKSGK